MTSLSGEEDLIVRSGSLRVATEADIPAIAELHLASWRCAYRGIVPAPYLDTVTIEDRLQRWQRAFPLSTDSRVLVAVAGDDLMGFCRFGRKRDGGGDRLGEVYSLHVHPHHWRKGWGTLLLDAAMREVRLSGYEAAVLWVLSANARARHFYEVAGWALTGEERVEDRGGYPIAEIRYQKTSNLVKERG